MSIPTKYRVCIEVEAIDGDWAGDSMKVTLDETRREVVTADYNRGIAAVVNCFETQMSLLSRDLHGEKPSL